jgi:hypothetical protein
MTAILFAVPFAVAVVLLFSFVFSIPVYFIWNNVVPQVFGLKAVTFFQAWLITLLCGFLFKGTGSTSKD